MAKGNIGSGSILFIAIADVFIGIMFLLNGVLVASILPFIFAMWLTFSGIEQFIHSFDMKKLGFGYWWTFMLLGIASLAVGICTIVEPIIGAVAISIFAATGFILHGIGYFAILIGINRIEKM